MRSELQTIEFYVCKNLQVDSEILKAQLDVNLL